MLFTYNSPTTKPRAKVLLFRLWPVQMVVQEFERACAVDSVGAIKEFDVGAVGQTQFGIKPPDLGVFVGDPLVGCHSIVMPALDHARARRDQSCHLSVTEGMAEIEFVHVILDRIKVAVTRIDGGAFLYPFIKIGGADRQTVTV